MLGAERENERVIEEDQKPYLISQQLCWESSLRAWFQSRLLSDAGAHCACAASEAKPHATPRAALSAHGRRDAHTPDGASPPLTSPLRGEAKMANFDSLLLSRESPRAQRLNSTGQSGDQSPI